MLLQLNITNFALIEKLSISFNKGFNILSGETGAGKSILIDAINYVLGSKFNKDFIRTGENRTYVEGVFSIENEKTKEIMNELGIEYEDMVVISRETFQSGKSVAKINGKTFLLTNVKRVTDTLLDIHGQHANQTLLEVSSHIIYLDYFANKQIEEVLEKYREDYDKIKAVEIKIRNLTGMDGEREKLVDFLKYQIDEIDKAKLKIGEDEELNSQYNILVNAQKINTVLSSAYQSLYNGEDEIPSIIDSLSIILKNIRTVENTTDKIKTIADSMESVYYILEENIEEIRNLKESIVYDEKEIEYINSRVYQIDNYKRKYGKTIEEILNYREKISIQFDEIVNSQEIIEKLKSEKQELLMKMCEHARILDEIRREVALDLENQVMRELKYIGLEKSIFKIQIELVDEYYDNGMNKVQFLITTNPGEPLKPLEKVVSGGELSRIMLAFKTVFVDKDKIPSIIFDEIDTGISGRTAVSVAEKMYLISTKHQVFCVTHLPQIACMSDVHYMVYKKVNGDKTFTEVEEANKHQKQEDIARMIGGAEVTDLTLKHAKELITIAENKKQELSKKNT